MACYRPLQGWRSRSIGENGRRGIVFSVSEGFIDLPVSVPCGQCIGCRLDQSLSWAVRCVHEAQLHDKSVFATFTYAKGKLPPGGSLFVKHFQDFMKRLRKARPPRSVRYFHCGEYGEKFERAHYHALLFGVDFEDKRFWKRSHTGDTLYTSKELDELWTHGYCNFGSVTFESAAYVARYVTKKVTGPEAVGWYQRVCADTGEVVSVAPEYTTMSLKPAIGRRWFERFGRDVFPNDEVIVRGRRMRPPRYYDKLHAKDDADAHRRIELRRIRRGNTRKVVANRSPERLRVREEVSRARVFSTLKRDYEK